jgi:hypothetical protein
LTNSFPCRWILGNNTSLWDHQAFPWILICYTYKRPFRCRKQAEVTQNHENANVRNIGQGELRHRKYRRLELGGGQAYDRSSDYTSVIAGATNDRA